MASGMKVVNAAKSSTAQPNGSQANGVVPKVVGPNVKGKREEYQLVRRLQSALFGGVYEAKGLSSGRDFAIKVLHKSELSKASESNSIEFCEVPLSEIRFADLMRGHEHVMEAEEHFEDAYCFYVVFDLARGGDLLEALKQKPHGFDEAQAQFLIRQAAEGLAYLHKRRVAMQDVSLENMLLHVTPNGQYSVKICDPGQAAVFNVDQTGEELPVNFRGLVGKSFRPPELHEQRPYMATKVDSWCLGWSTFYLLTAQPLFMTADPAQQDADWLLFQQGDFATLFMQKSNLCSPTGLDFIFRLLQIEPRRRMSIHDALNHAWLTDPKIAPVIAPKELWPESVEKAKRAEEAARQKEASLVAPAHVAPPEVMNSPAGQLSPQRSSGGLAPGSQQLPVGSSSPGLSTGVTGLSPMSSMAWSGGGSGELPTWAAANQAGYVGPQTPPMLRVRSPPRSPRSGITAAPRLPTDRRRAQQANGRYAVATAHSPAPVVQTPQSAWYQLPRSSATRTASPLQQNSVVVNAPTAMFRTASPGQALTVSQDGRRTFLTPRLTSRQSPTGAEEDEPRGRPGWAFRSADGSENGEALTGSRQFATLGRTTISPTRSAAAIVFPRSPSPVQTQASTMRALSPTLRASSPGLAVPRMAAADGMGFSWSQAPATYSPRAGFSPSTLLSSRPASPLHMMQPGALSAMPRAVSPVSIMKPGFAWSPDPPSPRVLSPRSYSPGPGKAAASALPRWGAQ
eukprot:TRINITY_DN112890_c0_g1_i1.p1 TRINITY_DN112890_c0_g1~~TRINITY_DN112890_c0_g1_i1.p1  ORF type:complete len:759 (+),score=134.49 TRINITY_DN112890_c0_g1_i1:66-2279(+)